MANPIDDFEHLWLPAFSESNLAHESRVLSGKKTILNPAQDQGASGARGQRQLKCCVNLRDRGQKSRRWLLIWRRLHRCGRSHRSWMTGWRSRRELLSSPAASMIPQSWQRCLPAWQSGARVEYANGFRQGRPWTRSGERRRSSGSRPKIFDHKARECLFPYGLAISLRLFPPTFTGIILAILTFRWGSRPGEC